MKREIPAEVDATETSGNSSISKDLGLNSGDSPLKVATTPMKKSTRDSSIGFKKTLPFSEDLFMNLPALNVTPEQSDEIILKV